MSKIYIKLKDLNKMIDKEATKQLGPILAIFSYVGLFLSILLAIPIVTLWVLLIACYIPFYYLDVLLIKRKNNDQNN